MGVRKRLAQEVALVRESVNPEPHYWLGRLSWALAHSITHRDRYVGEEALREFMRSPVPTPELKELLREELKK